MRKSEINEWKDWWTSVFIAWRELRFAKGRFALMGVVIVLITLLVGLLSGLTAGLGQQNVSAIESLPASHIAFDKPGKGQDPSYSSSTLSDQQVKAWQDESGADAEPLGITTTRATAAGQSAGVSVFGVQHGSGLAPASDRIQGRSVVLSTPAADDLGVTKGDSLSIAGEKLRVVDVRGDAQFSHTPVIWASLDAWRGMVPPSGSGGRPAASVMALQTGADIAAGDRAAGTSTMTTQDSLVGIGSYRSENGSLQLMRGFLFVISALVIGAFFTVWTIQRSADIAVLKALGARTGTLLKDALGQALMLLVAGTALGTALAVGAGAAVSGTDIPFALQASTIAVPAAVMITLGALGAALAVRRITSVDPLTALGSAR